MGAIGRWIDEKCRTEPEVMRRVLGRKFGDLAVFVDSDGKCGCLVGSYGLERHDTWALYREYAQPFDREGDGEVGGMVANMWERFAYGPSALGDRTAHARTVRILKQRIRKSLGIAPEVRPVQQLESVSG